MLSDGSNCLVKLIHSYEYGITLIVSISICLCNHAPTMLIGALGYRPVLQFF